MFRHLLYPFLPYRSLFHPFLVLTAIAVPCWLIFRMYRLRTSGLRTSFRRELLLVMFAVYLCGLATATLLPNHNSREVAASAKGIDLRPNLASLTCSSATLPSGSTAQGFCGHNAKGNVMLFFPLGILLPLVWTRLRFWKGLQIAIAVSCSIEIIQFLSRAWSNRNADINDVILNVVGAAFGLLIVFLGRLIRGTRRNVRIASAA